MYNILGENKKCGKRKEEITNYKGIINTFSYLNSQYKFAYITLTLDQNFAADFIGQQCPYAYKRPSRHNLT